MALGSSTAALVVLFVRRVSIVIAAGIAAGVLISLWAARLVDSLLYRVEPRDPATLAAAVLLLMSVGLLAGWLPAHRAARVDPSEVLRQE